MKKLFKDFMLLYYSETKLPSPRDIGLDFGIIARFEDISCNIYYLSTGFYINIPWAWVDLFSSLDTYDGARLGTMAICDDIEKTITLFLMFTHELYGKHGKNVLKILEAILDNKEAVRKFRSWYVDEFNKTLGEISIYSSDKIIKI